ncbi:hypothetical protein [Trinickia symbiotica]|uniref:hypothetical protein n=1 Tax=Trinickia symbiotica TaxID=863227 RepID=UPI0011B291A7|nr:hypothetical protein [Trinickia symbiotica]
MNWLLLNLVHGLYLRYTVGYCIADRLMLSIFLLLGINVIFLIPAGLLSQLLPSLLISHICRVSRALVDLLSGAARIVARAAACSHHASLCCSPTDEVFMCSRLLRVRVESCNKVYRSELTRWRKLSPVISAVTVIHNLEFSGGNASSSPHSVKRSDSSLL